ncbi:hypothetical protein [Spirosoma pomorum]
MKNEMSDEELQQLLDGASPSHRLPFISQPENDDVTTYQHLFTALKQSPPGSLSPNFSASVVNQIQLQQQRATNRRFYGVLSTLFLIGLALSVAWGGLLDFRSSQLVLQTLDQAKSWLFFGLGCLLIIQLLDHQLIKKRMRLLH